MSQPYDRLTILKFKYLELLKNKEKELRALQEKINMLDQFILELGVGCDERNQLEKPTEQPLETT